MAFSVHLEDGIIIAGKTQHYKLTSQLISYVPPEWTAVEAKRRGGTFWTLMSAFAKMFANIRGAIDLMRREMRLKSATGLTLDIISNDFFGSRDGVAMLRKISEPDDRYRNRIASELLRPRGTKPGIIAAVHSVTGVDPIVLETLSVNTMASWGGPSIQGINSNHLDYKTSNALSTTTKIYLISTTTILVGDTISVTGIATANGNPTFVATISSDGNGPFITLTNALASAPGNAVVVKDLTPIRPFVAGVRLLPALACFSSNSNQRFQEEDGSIIVPSIIASPSLGRPPTTDLAVWLKADSITLAPDASIDQWDDSSGHSRHFTATGTSRPVFKSLVIDGVASCVRFDNVNDFMTAAYSGGGFEDWTLLIAYRSRDANPTGANRSIVAAGSNLSVGPRGATYGANIRGTEYNTQLGVVDSYRVVQTISAFDPFVTYPDWGGYRTRMNGRPAGILKISPDTLGGALSLGLSGFPIFADVFELLYYNRTLNMQEVIDNESYLMQRWGATQPYNVAPNPGYGSFGGFQTNLPYNFYVFVTQNDNNATDEEILDVVRRTKPAGTVEHVFINA